MGTVLYVAYDDVFIIWEQNTANCKDIRLIYSRLKSGTGVPTVNHKTHSSAHGLGRENKPKVMEWYKQDNQ